MARQTEFKPIPAHADTKEEVEDLRHDLRVNSMDAVIRELLRTYKEASDE